MAAIGVIGSGTWGTALAVLLVQNKNQVALWSAFAEEADKIRTERKHPNLPEAVIPEELEITTDLQAAMEGKEILVLAVPSIFVRQTAAKIAPFCKKGQIVVNVSKGIEEKTLKTLSEVIEEELPMADVAVLSGPSHAEEVSHLLPTTCVAGAHKRETAEKIQTVFMSQAFRVYTSPDMIGIEVGAALKNVIALAAGMADGLGYGDNTKAALITRGIAEIGRLGAAMGGKPQTFAGNVIALAAGMADGLGYGDNTKAALITRGIAEIGRLGAAMGGKPQTFAGLSGIGDLIVTCASMHSRNRRAGILIGKGYSMEEAMKEVKMVVEGVYSAKAALALSKKYQVPMPIVEQVNQILFEGKPAKEAVADLMLRDRQIESRDLDWDV